MSIILSPARGVHVKAPPGPRSSFPFPYPAIYNLDMMERDMREIPAARIVVVAAVLKMATGGINRPFPGP